ncbi:MAG: alpha/beta fold hydrolase [Labilithrix sp.]|nr:alpha/beta fold hydrolase [Labilithrix sp.]
MRPARSRRDEGTNGRRRRAAKSEPRASFEELEIHTSDGVALRAVVDDPPEGARFAGTCVLAHAMFARKTEFGRRDRHGLAQAYAKEGWRTIAFDFRGHGDSTLPPGAPDWGYDDLVRLDLPAVVACARARSEGKPVVVVGHSLGGHVALASQGIGATSADGIVAIAANVWLRELEPSRLRWIAKRGVARAMLETIARVGALPARKLRMGSDDASARYVRDLLRTVTEGAWRSADGRDDYLASLARVTVPVCAVASTGDRLMCHPASAASLARLCRGPVEVIRVSRADDGSPAPGHMELVTTERARARLLAALGWVEARCA